MKTNTAGPEVRGTGQGATAAPRTPRDRRFSSHPAANTLRDAPAGEEQDVVRIVRLLSIAALASGFFALKAVLSGYWVTAAVDTATLLVTAWAAWFMRRRPTAKRIALAAHLFLGALTTMEVVLSLLEGAEFPQSLWWLAAVPLGAAYLLGQRAAIIWTATVVLVASATQLSSVTQGLLPVETPSRPLDLSLSRAGFFICVGAVAVLARRIADRRASQVMAAKELTDRLIESNPHGVVGFDKSLVVTAWNPAMSEMFGTDAAAALGRPALALEPFASAASDAADLAHVLAGNTVFTCERQFRLPGDSAVRYYEAHYTPILDASRHVVGGLGVFRDVTDFGDVINDLVREGQTNERQVVEQALLTERARIAGELHDLVAHHVGMIAVQSEAYAVRTDPEQAARIVEAMGSAARQALTEMGHLVTILSTNDGRARGDRSPAPGLTELAGLVDESRQRGFDTHLECTPSGTPLSPALQLTSYRIVQESLANVYKHAPQGARVDLSVSIDGPTLQIEVTNSGGTPGGQGGAPGAGHGLIGMRERVAMFRGRLESGPTADNGFRVLARLPLEHTG